MSIKFLVLGGGGYFGFGGGGECRFYFYGRADFSEICANRSVPIDPQKKKYFHSVRAICVNRLKPVFCYVYCPQARFTKMGSVLEPSGDSCEPGDSRESANRFG